MKSKEVLTKSLTTLPEYNKKIRDASQTERLLALSDLYEVYIPSEMSIEIYNKLYLALFYSLQKKNSQLTVRQKYENYKDIHKQAYTGILGGSDSFTIIGVSGIGKSSAVNKAVSIISSEDVIEVEKPYTKIIPFLTVQCPFDSSVKGLLLEILRQIDFLLDSGYYQNSIRSRNTTVDTLIGSVSTIALNHIGVLIVDEIQNVANSKNGKSLVGMLTQLINNSGISICMVGTPESSIFFEQALHLARRSIGLRYTNLEYDIYFQNFCVILFAYQYTKYETEIDEGIIEWLYHHSTGITSLVVSLIHDAQEIAILTGTEKLDIDSLEKAYNSRLSMVHEYIGELNRTKRYNRKIKNKNKQKKEEQNIIDTPDMDIIKNALTKSKEENKNIIDILKEQDLIIEVDV